MEDYFGIALQHVACLRPEPSPYTDLCREACRADDALKGVSKLAGKGDEKAIVIGEGMDAVQSAAKNLQSQGINAKWYQFWKKNIPTDRRMTPAELRASQARNVRWINSKMNQNYKIYDTGPRGSKIESDFYAVETEAIRERDYPTTFIGR